MDISLNLKLFLKKNFFTIIFIIIFIIISVIFLTKVKKYLILKKFSKIALLLFFQILFFLGIFVKKKRFFTFLLLIIIFLIYTLNLGIGIIDYNFDNLEKKDTKILKQMNLPNDKRNIHEFINEKKKKEKKYILM